MLSPRREARDLILSSLFIDEKTEGQRTKANVKTTCSDLNSWNENPYFCNINK